MYALVVLYLVLVSSIWFFQYFSVGHLLCFHCLITSARRFLFSSTTIKLQTAPKSTRAFLFDRKWWRELVMRELVDMHCMWTAVAAFFVALKMLCRVYIMRERMGSNSGQVSCTKYDFELPGHGLR